MRTSLVCATFVAGVLGLLAVSSSHAQKGGSATHGVALIDIGYVFKKCARFEHAMKAFKQDLEGIEKQIKAEQAQIGEMAKGLQELRAGTPAYKKKDEEITQRKADLAARASMQQKEFAEREARIYWQTYNEVAAEVKKFAQENHVSLVLRHISDPVDTSSQRSVMSGINRPVVFHAGLDISDLIKDELNRRAVGAAASGSPRPSGGPVSNRPAGTKSR